MAPLSAQGFNFKNGLNAEDREKEHILPQVTPADYPGGLFQMLLKAVGMLPHVDILDPL